MLSRRPGEISVGEVVRALEGPINIVSCLEDDHEYSRENALTALEKLGTSASLEPLERVAQSDPVERLRGMAAKAAQAARAR